MISREATKESSTLSKWLEGVAGQEEDLGPFSMPRLASMLRTAVEIGAVSGSSSGPDGSSRAPFAGGRTLADHEPLPMLEHEAGSHRRESGRLDLSRLTLSDGAWVRQMNWAVMQPYWQHRRTGETQWEEEPVGLTIQSRANLFRKRRRPWTMGRGDTCGKRGGILPPQKPIAKGQNSAAASMRSRPLRVA